MKILITGSSQGIGLEIAQVFLEHRHSVIITGRNSERIQNTAKQLSKKYNTTIPYVAVDLSTQEGCNHLFKEVKQISSTLDVLVNNAGQFQPGSILNEPEDNLRNMMDNNLFSAYFTTRAAYPFLKKNGKGHIFNICSIASLKAYHNGGAYSISKYALKGFNDNLRYELMNENIKVTGVYPGATATSSWEGVDLPEGRIMETKDIAYMIYAATQLSPQAVVEDIILRPQLGDL